MKDKVSILCSALLVMLLVLETVGLGIIVGREIFREEAVTQGAVVSVGELQEPYQPLGTQVPSEPQVPQESQETMEGNSASDIPETGSSEAVVEELPAESVYTVAVPRLYVFSGDIIAENVEEAAIAELKRGEDVTLLEENETYSRITTADGKTGYVWNDCIEQKKNFTKETLVSKVIVLDAGHQGKGNNDKEPVGPGSEETKPKVSSGTAGVATKVNEHVLNLEIALQLETELEKRGYTVIQVRRSADINISNVERAHLANMVRADAFIRIHADGSENPDTNGSMTICSTSSSKYPVREYYKQSYQLAECVLDEYTKCTGIKRKRIMESDNYSGINWCEVPVIIMEMGYMSNAEEDRKMQDKDFQLKMIEGMADGIDKYFDVSYVE